MRIYNFTLAILGLAATEVVAFPAMDAETAKRALANLNRDQKRSLEKEMRKRTVTFDATTQYVSTHGDHEFKAPDFEAGDVRGPCPGLNAAANHGYIDRTGVSTMFDIMNGVQDAYGMALDLAEFLAAYGSVFDGNGIGYSIGGPTKTSQVLLGNVAGVIGAPQGLSGSHNKYESDTSPTRGDLYMKGNDYTAQVDQFQQYYDALIENVDAQTQYDHLIDFRRCRWDDSLKNNGYFFYGPFSGVLVSPAGYSFPPRMMSNKSAEFPTGMLSRENLKSFFSITGKSGHFKYTIGHERIPENWYKLAPGDEYTIPGFLLDVVDHGLKYPNLLNIGGNTGEPDTFTGVDILDLTKGVYDATTLLEGNNLECFLYQITTSAVPDIAGGSNSGDSGGYGTVLSQLVQQNIGRLGCPQLNEIDNSQFSQFPGYTTCANGCNNYEPGSDGLGI